jgi:two-component system, sensor histidine kinase PdtaS
MAATPDQLQLDKVRRHVRILIDLGRIAGENSDLNRFLDQAVLQVARAVEIHHVKVLQYRQRSGDLLVAAGTGWKEGVVRSATLSSDLRSPPGRSFQTAEPVTIQNFREQADFVLSEFLKEHGIVSLANAPIMINGAAWGVLEVDSATPRDFSQDTVEFLVAAGALIGVFIRHHGSASSDAKQAAVAAAEAQNREVLLREMQHRVKNNFQLILASISIQKRRYSAGEVHRALDHIASRINAISLAHDQLSIRADVQIVKVSDYIRALCSTIRNQVENIEIDIESHDIELTIDRAVTLGLILNEVATNSIKHAFGEDGGRISVRLVTGVGYGEARLTIADNGRGMPKTLSGGSGLKLVQSLARQIGGTIDQRSSSSGTSTSLTFPAIS